MLLLVFTTTTAAANVCSVLCALHARAAAAQSDVMHEGHVTGNEDGAQSELCALAAAPALAPSALSITPAVAAYVPPLAAAVIDGVDPQPPLNPPPT